KGLGKPATPASPSRNPDQDGVGSRSAPRHWANQLKLSNRTFKATAAPFNNQGKSNSNSSAVPSKAAGTTSRLTQGIASTLASGALRLAGMFHHISHGHRPTNTTHCARPQRHQREVEPRRAPIP